MKQVLIIDDSPQIRRRIAERLAESHDIRIVGEAGNGRDAVEAIERIRPDTVILDIRLPDRSGVALLRMFKARYPEMTVIMLTNLDDARYRRQCRHLGADFFLSKTKEFEKIVDTVRANPAH
jgi:DNA-binding NarL/FixJ family response regulator